MLTELADAQIASYTRSKSLRSCELFMKWIFPVDFRLQLIIEIPAERKVA